MSQLSTKNLIDIISGDRKGIIPSVTRCFLFLLSFPYRIGAWLKNRKFDRDKSAATRVDVPVISIGNVTTGGTGKTPMVHWICNTLRGPVLNSTDQWPPIVTILSRGYGAVDGGLNDEGLELEIRLPDVPHLQNPDRVSSAQIAIDELETELIVLDDGFQHRKIARDLDIVLLDATNPFGFGHLLPRGLLREPVSSLSRANAAILTRSNLVNQSQRSQIKTRALAQNPDLVWAETVHAPNSFRSSTDNQKPVSEFQNLNVLALSGIGNPEGFISTLEGVGTTVIDSMEFPDHHRYTREDIDKISSWIQKTQKEHQQEVDAVVCTLKDLVKIRTDQIAGVELFALEINIEFLSGEDEVVELLRVQRDRQSPNG